jgi:hypothetical protein
MNLTSFSICSAKDPLHLTYPWVHVPSDGISNRVSIWKLFADDAPLAGGSVHRLRFGPLEIVYPNSP